MKIPSRSKFC